MQINNFTPERLHYFLDERGISLRKTIEQNKGIKTIFLKGFFNAFIEYNTNTKKWNLFYSSNGNPIITPIDNISEIIPLIESIPKDQRKSNHI